MKIETNEPSDNESIKRLKSEIRALLQKCKFLAKGIKTSRPTRCLSCPEPRPFDKGFADQMARLYISHFESALRIFHIPSFWTEYEQYWRNPADTADVIKFKIQLVIAVGCSLYQESDGSNQIYSTACQWIYAAQAWMSAPMEKDRLSISGLQVQCLLILARQCLSVSGDLIWIAMGTLVRTAMQMGLHRDPRHFAKMSLT
jgi:hypothetical protein